MNPNKVSLPLKQVLGKSQIDPNTNQKSSDRFYRYVTLLYAYPWVAFQIPVLARLWGVIDHLEALGTFISISIFIFLYLISWLLLPMGPTSIARAKRWWFIFGATLISQLACWGFSWNYGGAVFLVIYLISMVAFMAPKSWYVQLTLILLTLAIVEVNVPGTEVSQVAPTVFPLLFAMTLVGLSSRRLMEKGKEKEEQALARHRESEKRQRDKIAADLHDLLGQSLTALALHTDVAKLQLEKGNICDTKAALETVGKLARESLSDMRKAVTQLQDIDLESELASFRELMELRDLKVQIDPLPATWSPTRRKLSAWIVREAGTNILNHSNCSRVSVLFAEHCLAVIDNGKVTTSTSASSTPIKNEDGSELSYQSATSTDSDRLYLGGHGLVGLAKRIASSGEMFWGQLHSGAVQLVGGNHHAEEIYVQLTQLVQHLRPIEFRWGKNNHLPSSGFFVFIRFQPNI